jgi:hypothetical protein
VIQVGNRAQLQVHLTKPDGNPNEYENKPFIEIVSELHNNAIAIRANCAKTYNDRHVSETFQISITMQGPMKSASASRFRKRRIHSRHPPCTVYH